MAAADTTGTDSTPGEIDLIVADYFDMLALELRGEPFVKAHRNAALQQLTGRSKGSIEFKHQNISAVLLRLGRPWISGYKPMANFQKALIDGVERLSQVEGDGAGYDIHSFDLTGSERLLEVKTTAGHRTTHASTHTSQWRTVH